MRSQESGNLWIKEWVYQEFPGRPVVRAPWFYCWGPSFDLCSGNSNSTSHAGQLIFAAASLQSCPTLCDPIDGSPPGSTVPGILQARTLESVAIAFSNAWKWKVKVKSLSPVRLSATPCTAAYQAPLTMGLKRYKRVWMSEWVKEWMRPLPGVRHLKF